MSAKAFARDIAARVLRSAGVTSHARRHRGRLSIATFHRVLPQAERRAYPYPALAVTPEALESALRYLATHFDCGTLSAQHERFLRGDRTERPLLALTFDDAQYDNHRYAGPVLARLGLKATFFAPVVAIQRRELLWHDRLGFAVRALSEREDGSDGGLTGALAAAGVARARGADAVRETVQAAKRLPPAARVALVDTLVRAAGASEPEFARLMTFEELRDLAREGHEIGSHSMTHCLMPECDEQALAYEAGESRRVLEAEVRNPVASFCYPNGDADARCVRAVAEAGYARAVTTRWGANGPDADRFLLRRYDMDAGQFADDHGRVQPALLAFRMSGLYPGLG